MRNRGFVFSLFLLSSAPIGLSGLAALVVNVTAVTDMTRSPLVVACNESSIRQSVLWTLGQAESILSLVHDYWLLHEGLLLCRRDLRGERGRRTSLIRLTRITLSPLTKSISMFRFSIWINEYRSRDDALQISP